MPGLSAPLLSVRCWPCQVPGWEACSVTRGTYPDPRFSAPCRWSFLPLGAGGCSEAWQVSRFSILLFSAAVWISGLFFLASRETRGVPAHGTAGVALLICLDCLQVSAAGWTRVAACVVLPPLASCGRAGGLGLGAILTFRSLSFSLTMW